MKLIVNDVETEQLGLGLRIGASQSGHEDAEEQRGGGQPRRRVLAQHPARQFRRSP